MWVEDLEQPSALSCRRCGQEHRATPTPKNALHRCWICDCERLYRQRDFNRKLGLAVVAVAAVFSIKTYGLSLLAAALIDLLLYLMLPEIALCYHCEAIHRGFTLSKDMESYDLATHERFEDRDWGKRWNADSPA